MPSSTPSTFHGIGICPGTVAGPAVILAGRIGGDVAAAEPEPPCADPNAETERIAGMMANVAQEYRDLAASADSADARAMLEAAALLAVDRGLINAVSKRLHMGDGPKLAVRNAVEEYAALFRNLGGRLAERVADLEDIRDRTLAAMEKRAVGEGTGAQGGAHAIPALSEPSVIVARELAPADLTMLLGTNRDMVLGIVCEAGGATSHAAVLATQAGIPTVMRVTGLFDAMTDDSYDDSHSAGGRMIAFNGETGDVVLDPTDREIALLREQPDPGAELGLGAETISDPAVPDDSDSDAGAAGVPGAAVAQGGSVTADTNPEVREVKLLLNLSGSEDLAAMGETIAESDGVGLLRTEFLFLDRADAPSVTEQADLYERVLRAFPGRRVVIRTLDAGSDKPLAFLPRTDGDAEPNPALGVRGIRLSRVYESLLDDQLAALAEAFDRTYGDVDLWVMAPMIATVEEAEWFARKARAYGLPNVGVMIETPAAALCAREILDVVDFASIGTNDLTQYVMAADRCNSAVSGLLDPANPAVMRLIAMVGAAVRETGKPVGVCGEAAGDPRIAPKLVEMGVTSLSVAPARLSALRRSLARLSAE
ncbi:putative PEP-binding protein [Bifidobacterium vansinderenii]|uniref:Phosphoenolpyruvate-protein phosphotransferase n=1 Tax=Bifidobacterium vansinderenii TaxID=1984871 RepID=A0A229VZU8_9BIFI|nr:putative PEP-binding protein [Bifidobacterium vansinderenii]OXN01159.1 phosphoenolpyruvate--protein phosphotransferase [Bifidobacterium vansinderenii]